MAHEPYIQRCLELAALAVEAGNHPFGALLVHQGQVLLEAQNTVETEPNITAHAELNLVKTAHATFDKALLGESILYTSTEPCMMCCGAIYWAGIRHVVFGCRATAMNSVTGGSLSTPAQEILNRGDHVHQIEGPILEDAALQQHQAFWPGFLQT